eukprot:m.361457 g.361457  ORF g.361457 m.361457 type:complete len:362 (-) comp19613_c0_seq1:133-1218(-)
MESHNVTLDLDEPAHAFAAPASSSTDDEPTTWTNQGQVGANSVYAQAATGFPSPVSEKIHLTEFAAYSGLYATADEERVYLQAQCQPATSKLKLNEQRPGFPDTAAQPASPTKPPHTAHSLPGVWKIVCLVALLLSVASLSLALVLLMGSGTTASASSSSEQDVVPSTSNLQRALAQMNSSLFPAVQGLGDDMHQLAHRLSVQENATIQGMVNSTGVDFRLDNLEAYLPHLLQTVANLSQEWQDFDLKPKEEPHSSAVFEVTNCGIVWANGFYALAGSNNYERINSDGSSYNGPQGKVSITYIAGYKTQNGNVANPVFALTTTCPHYISYGGPPLTESRVFNPSDRYCGRGPEPGPSLTFL